MKKFIEITYQYQRDGVDKIGHQIIRPEDIVGVYQMDGYCNVRLTTFKGVVSVISPSYEELKEALLW